MATTASASPKTVIGRVIDFNSSGIYFGALLAVALLAFWPSYLSPASPTYNRYTHLHAFTATLWMLLLIVQPLAIRYKRRPLHRLLGKLSYVIAPMVVVSMLLLANNRLHGLTPEAYAIQEYVLYLQLSLAVLFTLCYGAAIATRHKQALHARFMIGTGLTLIDPVLIRVMFWAAPVPSFNYQWVTFGVTDLVLAVLVWRERNRPAPRWVFRTMLAAFVVSHVPALFALTSSDLWRGIVRWYAALPLT